MSRFHSFIVLSLLPEARVLPSGLKLTELTELEWPDNVLVSAKVSRFHSFIVLSWLPEDRGLPSGLKLTERTELEWPDNVLVSAKVFRFHSFIISEQRREGREGFGCWNKNS